MFIGDSEQNLDPKGRIRLPAKFREVINTTYQGKLVITRFFDGCLTLYPLEEWQTIKSKWTELPTEGLRNRQRFINALAELCELDKQGRLLIPQKLREYAELNKEVTLIGMDKKIEIWSKEKWNEFNDNLKNKSKELPPADIDKMTEIGF